MANQPPSAPVPPQGFFPFPGTEDQEHPQQQQQQQQQHQQQLQQEQLPAPPQFQQQSGQQIPQQQLQLRQQPGNPRVPPPMPGQPPMAMVPRQPMSAMAGHFCPMCNLYTAPGTYSQCGCNSFMLVQQPPYMAAHGPSPYPPMLEQNPWVMPGLPPPMHHGHMPYPPPMMMRGPPALYPPPGFMAFPPLPLPPPPHHYPRSQPHHGFMYPPHYQPAPPPTHHFGFDHHNVMFMQHPPMMVPMQPGFMPHQPMAPRPTPPPPHQMPRAPRPPAQRAQPPVPQGLQGMSIEARQGLIQVPASEVDSDSETCTSRPPNPDHVRLPTMMEYLGIAPRSGRTVQSVLDSELAKEQERASRRPPRSGAEGDAASSTHEDGKPEAMSDSDSDDGIRVIFPACGRPMDDDEVCLFEGGLPPTRNRRDYDVDHLRVAERNFNLFSRRRQHRRHREQ